MFRNMVGRKAERCRNEKQAGLFGLIRQEQEKRICREISIDIGLYNSNNLK